MTTISAPDGHQIEIEGFIYVDVAPFVSESMGMGEDGYKHMWSVIAGAPVGVKLRFNLGKLRYFDKGKLPQALDDLPHKRLKGVEIQGEDTQAIRTLHQLVSEVLAGGWGKQPSWPPKNGGRRCVHCMHETPGEHWPHCPAEQLKQQRAA